MPKCSKTDCGKEATQGLKILLFAPDSDVAAEAYLALPVCDEHPMDEESVRLTLMNNWAKICIGFEHLGKKTPMLARTLWKWVPWSEVEDFYKRQEMQNTKQVYKN